MPRWEYMAESMPAGANGHMDKIIDRLNELGSDGWETVDMRLTPVSQFLTFTLKRELQPKQTRQYTTTVLDPGLMEKDAHLGHGRFEQDT